LKSLLLTYFFCLIHLQLAAQTFLAKGEDPTRQIITEQMIKSAGIVSMADIVTLANNWNIYSIDGTSGFYSANSLSSYDRQGVITFIDGLRTDVEIFDVQNLNLLPVSVDQVDFVEFVSIPCIYLGNFATSGVIHIHTKNPAPGLSIQGIHTIGDETGDPGPLVFTEFSSPNVDKLAQLFSVGVSSAGDSWFMTAHLKHEETFETDPAVNQRLSYLNNDDNKSKLISYWFKSGANILNGIQQFSIAVTTNNDFFFFKPYGNEIPVKQTFRQFGFNGYSRIAEFGFNYSAKLSLNEPGYLTNNKQIYFDFAMNNYSFNLEAYYQAPFFRLTLGAGNDKYSSATTSVLTDRNNSLRSLYIQADVNTTNNLTQSFGIFATRNYKDYSLKSFLNSLWKVNANHSLFAGFSYMEVLFAEDNNYWVWREKGYKFNYSGDDYITPADFNTKRIFTSDLGYFLKIDSALFFKAGVNLRRFSDYYIEKQLFQFDSETNTFNSLIEVKPEEYLESEGAYAGINYKIAEDLGTSLFYGFTSYINGSELFKEVWNNLPKHNVTLSINYQPYTNFGFYARLKYYSPTKWQEYKYVSYQSDEEYVMDVKSGILVDISTDLWLWNRKIWINAIAKNIFNEPEKYYTAGADLDLRVYIQLHFYFNSLVK
jgi:hypothetical protein